jgi:hypothetical protein
MGETATESRSVHICCEVVPDNIESEDDLTNLGRFIIEVARDEMLREDDPVAWRKQNPLPSEEE